MARNKLLLSAIRVHLGTVLEYKPAGALLLSRCCGFSIAQNTNKSSHYYSKIDASKIAVSDMSCGRVQMPEVASDPRITTAMVCNSGILGNAGGRMEGMPGLNKEHLGNCMRPRLCRIAARWT